MNPPDAALRKTLALEWAQASVALAARLDAHEEEACLGLLATLCRGCGKFRRWLWREFGRKSRVRRRLTRTLKATTLPQRLVDLGTGRKRPPKIARRAHGGLTANEVRQLLDQYESGLDPLILRLMRQWSEPLKPAVWWAGIQFLGTLFSGRRWRAVDQVAKAFAYLRRTETPAERRNRIGYIDWWKLQTLAYILANPKRAYCTREFIAHLARQGLEVRSLSIRRFCRRHGIRRDTRPGRPRRLSADPTRPSAARVAGARSGFERRLGPVGVPGAPGRA